jgi:glycosyltransferase involved in cell wall biosynthesis
MNAQRKVTVSCATKFHSDYMAFQLQKSDLLAKVYTAHPKTRYLNRVAINPRKVVFLPPMFALVYVINKISAHLYKLGKLLEYKLPIVFDRMVASRLKNTDVLIVWAWAGLASILKVKKQGGIVILEEVGSCNKFQNEILSQEYESLGLKFLTPTPEKIVTRELKEAENADYILCPSAHVAQSFIINGFPKEKCVIIPFGVNMELFKPSNKQKGSFSIIMVGSIGVRKGLIYLFKALEILNTKHPVNCTLIGKVEHDFKPIFEKYCHLFQHIEQVPHHDLVKYYEQASVFVLPSLDEGMAYVQLEAMACGLPVICTPNSGGDSVIQNGIDGFIIPIRDPASLADKIEILSTNPDLLASMATQAHQTASNFTWDKYGEKLTAFIHSLPNRN